jgi:hypothetical protein
MARQRTTFGKIMREREKQQRAQAKQEKRAERTSEDDEEIEETPSHDQDDVLASLAKLHEAYDNEQIDFDTFDERRTELMAKIKID